MHSDQPPKGSNFRYIETSNETKGVEIPSPKVGLRGEWGYLSAGETANWDDHLVLP